MTVNAHITTRAVLPLVYHEPGPPAGTGLTLIETGTFTVATYTRPGIDVNVGMAVAGGQAMDHVNFAIVRPAPTASILQYQPEVTILSSLVLRVRVSDIKFVELVNGEDISAVTWRYLVVGC